MTVVTTIDVYDMTNAESRAVLDLMGVEVRPEPGITCTSRPSRLRYRFLEIRDSQAGFKEFAQRHLVPAMKELGVDRKAEFTVKPLHNHVCPRL